MAFACVGWVWSLCILQKRNPDWNDKIAIPDYSDEIHDEAGDVINRLHSVVKSNMDQTVLDIDKKVSGCQQFAVEIAPRQNWYPAICNAGFGISMCMKTKHGETVTKTKKAKNHTMRSTLMTKGIWY